MNDDLRCFGVCQVTKRSIKSGQAVSVRGGIDALGNDHWDFKSTRSEEHHDVRKVNERYYNVGLERGNGSPKRHYPGDDSKNPRETRSFDSAPKMSSSHGVGNIVERYFRSRVQCNKCRLVARPGKVIAKLGHNPLCTASLHARDHTDHSE